MASSREAESLDRLATEARRADTDYASHSTEDLVRLMNGEDASVPAAVAAVADADACGGVSASGRTPYVRAALEAAAEAGALTVALTAVEGSALARTADHGLAVVVGAEFVSGSTRLKAGTAQKLVLNTISTV